MLQTSTCAILLTSVARDLWYGLRGEFLSLVLGNEDFFPIYDIDAFRQFAV